MAKIQWSVVPAGMTGGELVPHLSARARMQMVDMVFEEIGGFQRFADWARREETEFYRIYARGAVRSTSVENTPSVTPEDLMEEADRRMKIINGEATHDEPGDE